MAFYFLLWIKILMSKQIFPFVFKLSLIVLRDFTNSHLYFFTFLLFNIQLVTCSERLSV